MAGYTPPPRDLSRLNPIQRYLQKGELDRQDWLRLIALVALYFIIRPYLHKGAKWLFAPKEGEEATKAYYERRQKAKIDANEIREGKKSTTTGDNGLIDELAISQDDDSAVVTGSNIKRSNTREAGQGVKSRKPMTSSSSTSATKKSQPKSSQDELLDWDDEPARKPVDGDKSDVMQWLDKWDKEQDGN